MNAISSLPPDSSPAASSLDGERVTWLHHDLPVFLVGMMGAGKTTIGKRLARACGREFLDLDHELEARCGVRIPVIFEIEGEQGFRRRETAVLNECTLQRGIILATGGGAPVAQVNRDLLARRGIVVYLRASVDELWRRTCSDRNRPMLATSDPRKSLREILARREPIYEEVADIVVDTGSVSISQVLKNLVPVLQDYQKAVSLEPMPMEPCPALGQQVVTPGK